MITCIYRSPNENISLFLDGLEVYLNSNNKSCNSIVCGDLNINILKNTLISTEYLNIMSSNDFISCINNYTRVYNTSQSCIDHIFIRNIVTDNTNSFILKSDITDHYATIIYIQNSNNLNHNTDINLPEIRNIINIEHLNMLINTEDWDNVQRNNDVNNVYESFNKTINHLISLSSNNVTRSFKNR